MNSATTPRPTINASGSAAGGLPVAQSISTNAERGHHAATDPALWTIRPAFGVAGGPNEIALTDEGNARAFSVGARVRRGAPANALIALATAGGEGVLSLCVGSRHRVTGLGRFDQLAWGHLRALGYVESFAPVHGVHGDGVRLTASGRCAVWNGYEERESLLERCRRAAGRASWNAFKAANRAVKVEGICRALDRFSAHRGAPVRAVDVLKWSDDAWEIFAWASGVTTPSTETRTAVLDRLVERDEVVLLSNGAAR